MDNRERIEEVYRLYEQKMYRIAFSILGDVTDAEDAVQDAFLKLVRLVRKLEDPASDRTKRYVLRAIQSTSIDIYRKNNKEREHRLDHEVESVVGDMPSTETLYSHREEIRERLAELSEDQREAVTLHLIGGMFFEEIAKEKNISLAAVRRRYERGLRKLKMLSGEDG